MLILSIYCRNYEEASSPSTPRRDSLGNIQNFIKTLAYWKKQPSSKTSANNNNNNVEEPRKPSKVERSRSFSIKCDKGYSTYYQIEPRKIQPKQQQTEMAETVSQIETYHYQNPRKFSNIHQVGLPLQPPVKR